MEKFALGSITSPSLLPLLIPLSFLSPSLLLSFPSPPRSLLSLFPSLAYALELWPPKRESRERCKLPKRGPGGAQAENEFDALYKAARNGRKPLVEIVFSILKLMFKITKLDLG